MVSWCDASTGLTGILCQHGLAIGRGHPLMAGVMEGYSSAPMASSGRWRMKCS